MIDPIKDTTLDVIVGITDLFGVISLALRDQAWLGPARKGYVFAGAGLLRLLLRLVPHLDVARAEPGPRASAAPRFQHPAAVIVRPAPSTCPHLPRGERRAMNRCVIRSISAETAFTLRQTPIRDQLQPVAVEVVQPLGDVPNSALTKRGFSRPALVRS